MKKVMIFDLDGTVVNSEWRTPRKKSGSVDISKWVDLATPSNVAKDTLLPLAKVMKKAIASKDFVVVATARVFTDADKKFLVDNGINPNIVISRSIKELKKPDADLKWNKLNRLFNLKQFKNVPKVMFEDNGSVLSKMRENGIVALNSLKVNKRLA
tara:strand:- start:814 stop:1281 length:468 start_codon:yes stop_codon:yes gene_type:complete